jgi:hypothetical protein
MTNVQVLALLVILLDFALIWLTVRVQKKFVRILTGVLATAVFVYWLYTFPLYEIFH